MTVDDIIKAVRWCYDEEQMNSADFGDASANDNTLMDNIIKAKIGDAVRWICLYCPPELLGGSDTKKTQGGGQVEVPTGILVDKTPTVDPISGTTGGKFTLEPDFIRLARVRVNTWHRAVINPITEDSDEYLQLRDTNAAATEDRPQAAIIDKATKVLEVWPKGASAEYTYVAAAEPVGLDNSGNVPSSDADIKQYALPPRAKTAFIYYLAFLVLSAYEDSRAPRMLEIANMNTGRNG